MFRLAYNTNGLAHHRVLDAIRLLAELGYEGIAITPDVGQLDPYDLDPVLVRDARRWVDELSLEVAIETGARFVLDGRRKHWPTLLDDEPAARERRLDFLGRCIDLAADLGAGVVSLWAGRAPGDLCADRAEPPGPGAGDSAAVEVAWERLVAGLESLLARSAERGVQLAFEPEPGMFIERPSGYEELVQRLGSAGDTLGLCLDVGHLHCTGDLPAPDVIRRYGNRLVQVHLDDIRDGIHEHRMFGEGDVDLPGILSTLLDVGYDGLAAVELSRDSHRGAEAAAEALEHLHRALTLAGGRR